MTDSIKNFIEENIDIIDDQNWEELVDTWYEQFSSDFFSSDDYFTEFAEVLQKAGIDFMNQTDQTRKEFMSNLIDQILHDELESYYIRNFDFTKMDAFFEDIKAFLVS